MRFQLVFLFSSLLMIFNSGVISQNIIENQILVHLNKTNTAINFRDANLKEQIARNFELTGEIKITDICTEPIIIKKIEFDERNKNTESVIDFLNSREYVAYAQFNHTVENRAIPNDSLFGQQWHLNNTGQSGGIPDADIDADLAWDLTTGGTTKTGDTIVICVVDNGLDILHEDIIENLWINHLEIPDNGIDDDNNSFIDDYYGWNTRDNNGILPAGSHGTSVSGLIGAKADNKEGVAGINWNVKILPVFQGDEEAHTLASYAYAYKLRKMYNESNGAKGAFIVATNSSFGVDYAKADEHPIWCSMYDSLGSVGIINIVATTNTNTDVDIYGDMPSTCPGDFVVSVTNIDQYNNKVNGAGYGSKNIDIGGYGAGVLTIRPGDRYTSFNGTSAATPVVTGVVGLIYSYSEKIAEIALTNPSQAALMAKEALLEGSKPLNSLQNITVTGGVVNAYQSLLYINKYDSECAPPYIINIDTVGADIIGVSWNTEESKTYNLAYRKNNSNWITVEKISSPFIIEDIDYCSEVELKLQMICSDTLGPFGYTLKLNTQGCCTSPEINDYYIQNEKIHCGWEDVFAAENYYFIYKYWSDPVWDTLITDKNFIDLDYDINCGKIAAYIKSECGDTFSYDNKFYVLGQECQECKISEYCSPSIDNDYEWIAKVKINGFENISGKNSDGYGIFNHTPSIKLIQNETYTLQTDIGFSGTIYSDSLFVWIDLDNDGIFQSKELICRAFNNQSKEIDANFTIPKLLYTGTTRMRIMLSAYSISDPCEIGNNDYGEYEDYCVVLDTINHCSLSDISIASTTFATGDVQIKWNQAGDHYKYLVMLREKDSETEFYPIAFTNDTLLNINGLDTCTNYDIKVGFYCTPIDISYSDIYTFKTYCSNAINEIDPQQFIIYPNPTENELVISTAGENRNFDIQLFDLFGRKIYEKTGISVKLNINLGYLNLRSGIYMLKLSSGNTKYNHKVIKL